LIPSNNSSNVAKAAEAIAVQYQQRSSSNEIAAVAQQ